MRKKVVNILFSMLSVGLALSLFFVGVLAATRTAASITNTFSFDVSQEDVFVEITGEVTGYAGEQTIPNYYHGYNNTGIDNFIRWNVPDLTFAEEFGQPQDIVFTFTIANYNQDKTIRAEITNYVSSPASTKIVNLPSPAVTIDPLVIDGEEEIVESATISLAVRVIDDSTNFEEINNFTLLISVLGD